MNPNIDVIIGLACATAFFRSGWDSSASIEDVNENGDWNEIIELAQNYCLDAGIGDVTITSGLIKESIWGFDDAEYEDEDEEDEEDED